MLDTLVATLLALSAVVTAAVTTIKPLLLKIPAFEALNASAQSFVYQLVAIIVDVFVAYSAQANILSTFPAFASIPAWLGMLVTGLATSTGSQGIYVVLSLLAGHVIPSAQAVAGKDLGEYAPFV